MRVTALKLFKRFLALKTVVALTLFAVRASRPQAGRSLTFGIPTCPTN